jgi:EmrB/QacA subfamily drug resistance transporter
MQYKWTALVITILGTFISSLSIRIVVIGLPTIASQLRVDAAEAIWIGQSYLLAQLSLLLFVGRISDLYGRVRLFNIGFILFSIGSTLSALAQNGDQLIAFRVVQGAAAAFLATNSAAIMTDASPKNELGKFLGMNQTSFRFGSIAGLTLSGLILSFVNWRGLFYVNIPIGIIGFLLGYRKLREVSTEDTTKKLDWVGSVIFALGLTSALLAVTFLSYGLSGLDLGLVLLAIGMVLIVLFVIRESSISFPILDLKLFRNKAFAGGSIAASLNAVTWGVVTIIIAFYLQIGLGYSPLKAGLAIIPLDVAYLIASVVFGNLSDRYGSRGLSTLGLAITGIGFLLMATFSITTQYLEIALVLFIAGLGNGMFSSPNTRGIMGSVPIDRRGIASGFYSTTFSIGFTAAFGLTILFLTLGIPYDKLSLLLQGAMQTPLALATAEAQFLTGFRIANLILAVISFLAAVIAAMSVSKGSEHDMRVKKEDVA